MTTHPRAIASRILDPWFAGGISLVVLGSFLLLSSQVPSTVVVGNFLVLTVLINGSHFMASYFLLYSSQEFIKRYRWASLYLPSILVSVGALGLWIATGPLHDDFIIRAMLLIASLYLALHYTGQTWGMMASYAFIHDIKFTQVERRGFRLCLRLLAAWHVGWALFYLPPDYGPQFLKPLAIQLIKVLHVAAVFSSGLGAALLWLVSRRIGSILPAAIIVPFISIYIWYAFLWIYPQSLFWVQIFHALQYLAFPARVELNRSTTHVPTATARWQHLLTYSLVLTVTSTVVFVCVEGYLMAPGRGFHPYWFVIAAIINIHHYFIDGCIWHISNPEVRRDLFAHIAK
jgi:hypothetical protein